VWNRVSRHALDAWACSTLCARAWLMLQTFDPSLAETTATVSLVAGEG
jgi:hypothetical protein